MATILYFVEGLGSLNDLSAIPNGDASTVAKVINEIQGVRSGSYTFEFRQPDDMWIAQKHWNQPAPPKDSQNRIVVKLIPAQGTLQSFFIAVFCFLFVYSHSHAQL